MNRAIRRIAFGLLWLPATAYGGEEASSVPAEPAPAPEAQVDPVTMDPAAAELAAIKSAVGDSAAPGQQSDAIVRERTALNKDDRAATDVTLGLRTRVGGGVALLGPLGPAVRLSLLHGLGADVRDDGVRVKAVCAIPIPHCAKGILMQADAGTGGGKLSLGVGAYAKVHEESFKGTAGVALRMAVAHTWGDPIGTLPGLTYVGPEMDLSILRVNVTLGTLFRVAGNGGKGMLFSWGIGFGS